jgi:hypothetical protein
VAARLEFSAGVDPDGLRQIDMTRKNFLDSKHVDPITVRLIAFAILLTQTSDAARSAFHIYVAAFRLRNATAAKILLRLARSQQSLPTNVSQDPFG